MDKIIPDTISFQGSVEFANAEEVLDVLSELKEMDSLDHFNNQVIDLEDEEPIIAFLNKSNDNHHNTLTLRAAPHPENIPPEPPGAREESVELELNTLAVSTSFVHGEQEVLESAIEEVIDVVGEIEIQYLYFLFSFDDDFGDLATMSRMDEVTEFNLSGVQFKLDDRLLSFQKMEEGTNVYVTYEGDEKINEGSFGDFIEEQIQSIEPPIGRICYEE